MTTAIKERPILFSAEMVRAILRGTKTQTRRVVKSPIHTMPCPPGQRGDRLWVRESFYVDLIPYDTARLPAEAPEEITNNIYYRASGTCCEQIPECSCAEVGPVRWRSSIHMPRWASRITLEITDVRVQRVQEISEEDAIAEGVTPKPIDVRPGHAYREEFRELWDKLNAGRGFGWEVNPWVWATEFKRLAYKAAGGGVETGWRLRCGCK